MRFYTKQHKFYCGIDLHTNKMYLYLLDETGEIRVHQECIFTWYWISNSHLAGSRLFAGPLKRCLRSFQTFMVS